MYPSEKNRVRGRPEKLQGRSPASLHGGGKGIRTPDLLIANETLYQLSYTPSSEAGEDTRNAARPASIFRP